MSITVEISLYPLHKDFGNDILSFIKTLKTYDDLEIRTNNMSTQITGSFERVMEAITASLKHTMVADTNIISVMKIYNASVDLQWIDI